jgi:hypothetical protein
MGSLRGRDRRHVREIHAARRGGEGGLRRIVAAVAVSTAK